MKALYFDNDIKRIVALKAAAVFDKRAAFRSFSPVQYADVPEPRLPNERWLKVRNLSCGLCGTDVHFLFMEMDPGCFPAATPGIARKFLGHELVGEVVEAGDAVVDVRVGDRVAMRLDWPSCFQLEITPPCRHCAVGAYMLCENVGRKELPLRDVGGGFSPFMVMHRSQPFRLPEALAGDRALLLEPTASALHGVLKARPELGDKVLVIGAGTIGLLAAAIVKALTPEAKVTVVARYGFQADMARRMGADAVAPGGRTAYADLARLTNARHLRGHFGNEILLGGFDVVYDTVGNDGSLRDALRWARAGGSVVLLGINFQPGKLDYSPIWSQEVRVTGINCHATEEDGRTSFDWAAELLADRSFPVDGMVTHRFPMARWRDAVEAFLDKKSAKAIKIALDHK
jgi:2-desacetyl-2-hydroxyethyl bacteriochlorophyllide A dehydrogenase